MYGVDRAQLRHDQRGRAQAGRGGFGVRDRELNPDDAGSGLGHDLELFSELLVEGALEIGRQRLLSEGATLLVSSPQNVTGSMRTLLYCCHCAAGLK